MVSSDRADINGEDIKKELAETPDLSTLELGEKLGRAEETRLHVLARTPGMEKELERLLKAGADANACNFHDSTPLHVALSPGYVRLLVEYGASFDAVNKTGDTPLFTQVYAERPNTVAEMVALDPAQLNRKIGDGDAASTPLHKAVCSTVVETVKMLLDAGANVNAVDGNGKTPLHHAIGKNRPRIARLLIEHGADLNKLPPGCGTTPLLHALDPKTRTQHNDQNLETIELLLELGADPDAPGGDGARPLHVAMAQDDMEAVALLCSYGADLTLSNDKTGASLLHYALESRHGAAVMQALDALDDFNGVDLDMRGGDCEETLLHILARTQGGVPYMERLLKAGADPNVGNFSKSTPLHVALTPAHIRKLVEYGGDLCARSDEGAMPILYQTVYDHADCVAEIIDLAPETINHLPDSGRRNDSAIHHAVENGKHGIARMLLEAGGNANLTLKTGYAPLHIAAEKGDAEMIRLLVEFGADLNKAHNEHKVTPLASILSHSHREKCEGDNSVVKLLLDLGADPNQPDENGNRPIHMALSQGDGALVDLFRAYGGDIRLGNDKTNETPLHMALHGEGTEMIDLVLSEGIDIDARDKRGDTVLRKALLTVVHQDAKIEKLVKAGADPNLPNAENRHILHDLFTGIQLGNLDAYLGAKPDANMRDAEGNTPLLAFLKKNGSKYGASKTVGIVARLLRAGADPAAKNDAGEGALDLIEGVEELSEIAGMIKDAENGTLPAIQEEVQEAEPGVPGLYKGLGR